MFPCPDTHTFSYSSWEDIAMRYLRLLCLFCCLCWWEACVPPYWIILGWDYDVMAQTVETIPIDRAIDECFVKTKQLQDLMTYAEEHKESVVGHYWDICILSGMAIDLYAKECAVLLECKKDGIEKHQDHLMALGHILWHVCTPLQNIMNKLGIILEKKGI